jgi:nitroreductase
LLLMTDFDLGTVDHLLSTTRAVRRRLDLSRPVPRPVIVECLRLAIQAPTGSNAQLWRWVVVEDPAVRSSLADLYRSPPAPPPAAAPVAPIAPIARPGVELAGQQERMMDSVRFLREHLHEVPVLVVPCTEKKGGAAGWPPSIYPAVWSFMLALRSRGLGSCITTAHLHHEREAAALLGIPDDYAQACLLPVAYYTGDDFRPATRRPIEEITYFDGWDRTTT